MKIHFGLEYPGLPFTIGPFLSEVRNALMEDVVNLVKHGAFNLDVIGETYVTVIRVYEQQRFESFPDFYKPVVKIGRKPPAVLITQDIYIEELVDKDFEYVYNRFLACILNSVEKLPASRIENAKIEEFTIALKSLRK